MGSWKIIEISLPRILRISFSGSVRRSVPLNRISPLDNFAGGIGDQPQDAQGGGGLAGAGLPHQAQGVPGLQGDVDAVDRVDHHAVALVLDHQIFDL